MKLVRLREYISFKNDDIYAMISRIFVYFNSNTFRYIIDKKKSCLTTMRKKSDEVTLEVRLVHL